MKVMRQPPTSKTESSAWWGHFEIDDETAAHWQVGSLRLWASRLGGRWRISSLQDDDPLVSTQLLKLPYPIAEVPAAAATQVFATSRVYTGMALLPGLATRPVVARPLDSLVVQPDDEATLFVSSSLWLQASWSGVATPLIDLAIFRPSDTWFGLSQAEGELCYVTRTRALPSADDLTWLPGRAVTRVQLRNRSRVRLAVERIKLPVTRLALHADAAGRLWTDSLTYIVSGAGADADVERDNRAPAEAGPCTLVAPPREEGQLMHWKRTLSALLG